MRAEVLVTDAGSCRCDANRPNRPSKTRGGPVAPACASIAACMPFCAAKPECRNFVCVPSTQHSSSPAARLPTCRRPTPFARTSRPSSLPGSDRRCRTARRARWGETRAGGTGPGTTEPTRQAISLAIAMARIRSRPLTARVSASASAVATAGLLMCTIDSLCVSSNSSACANAALANAAAPTATAVAAAPHAARPVRRHRRASRAARIAPNGVAEPGQRQADHVENAQLRGCRRRPRARSSKVEARRPSRRRCAGERRASVTDRVSHASSLRLERTFSDHASERRREQEPAERHLTGAGTTRSGRVSQPMIVGPDEAARSCRSS